MLEAVPSRRIDAANETNCLIPKDSGCGKTPRLMRATHQSR